MHDADWPLSNQLAGIQEILLNKECIFDGTILSCISHASTKAKERGKHVFSASTALEKKAV
jgi:hypothetical protein